jgi:hypothetical protein
MSRLTLAMLSVLVNFVVPAASYDKLNPKDADVDSKAVERFISNARHQYIRQRIFNWSSEVIAERDQKRKAYEQWEEESKKRGLRQSAKVEMTRLDDPTILWRRPSYVDEYGEMVFGYFFVEEILNKNAALMKDVKINQTLTRPDSERAWRVETKRENYLFIVEGIDTTHTSVKKGARIRGVFALVNKATYKATDDATELLLVFRKVGDIDLP